MSKLTDRASYLKGLAAGLRLNEDKDANKLLLEMLDVIGEMAEELTDLAEAHEELSEYVESIDDDLADLEETLFGEEDGEIDEEMAEGDEDEDDLGDDDLIVYACPHCGHEIEFSASDVDFDEDFLCPACDKPIFPELNDEE